MEYLVLNSYLKMKNEHKNDWKIAFKNQRLLYKVLSVILIMDLLLIVVSFFLSVKIMHNNLFIYGFILEFIIVKTQSICMQNDSIKKSSEQIEILDRKYEETKAWLKEIGYNNKQQIMQICNRCRYQIEENERDKEKKLKFIEMMVTVFLVPIYGPLILKIAGERGGTFEYGIEAVIATLFFIGLTSFIFGVCKFYKFFTDRTYIKMDSMVMRIEGMLDRELEDADNAIQ